MVTLITSLIFTLTLHKIGAVKHTLMWAEIDTTNDSIMWYAISYGNNDYGIYHDGKRVWYMKEGETYINGYMVSDIYYKIYRPNNLIFTIIMYDTSDNSNRLYFINSHGEIYRQENDFSDLISQTVTRSVIMPLEDEDMIDSTVLDTIINGHCIGANYIETVIDTDLISIIFTYEGTNPFGTKVDTFSVSAYVDLRNRRVLDETIYPYLYCDAENLPVKEGSFVAALRHDTIFVSRIYPEVQLLYTKTIEGYTWGPVISPDTQYLRVTTDTMTYIYDLHTGELIALLTPDSLPPVHYGWRQRNAGGRFVNGYLIVKGYITKVTSSSVYLYRIKPFKLLTWAEYPGYDIGGASCDKEGRLYIGMRDTLRGDTVKIFVIDTLQNIVGQYQFPTNIPNDRYGVGTYLFGKYLHVKVPDFLADSTYVFKVEE